MSEGADLCEQTQPMPLNATVVAALSRHRTQQLEQRLRMGDAWHEEDLVFMRIDGFPLRANHVLQRMFTPVLKRAWLPPIRFHDLRHTAATLLLVQGIHPKGVRRCWATQR